LRRREGRGRLTWGSPCLGGFGIRLLKCAHASLEVSQVSCDLANFCLDLANFCINLANFCSKLGHRVGQVSDIAFGGQISHEAFKDLNSDRVIPSSPRAGGWRRRSSLSRRKGGLMSPASRFARARRVRLTKGSIVPPTLLLRASILILAALVVLVIAPAVPVPRMTVTIITHIQVII